MMTMTRHQYHHQHQSDANSSVILSRVLDRMTTRICIIVMLLLPTATNTVHAFASFFVDRSSACFLNLRDPHEVIMNAYIVPADQSPFPNTSLFLQVTPSTEHLSSLNAVQRVPNNNIELNVHEFSEWTFQVNFVYPQKQLADLQFVVDVTTLSPPTTEGQEDPSSDSLFKAQFQSSRKIGCRNTRVYGRGKDHETFTLHITLVHETLVAFHEKRTLGEQQQYQVQLIAAWATGHEAVKLTHPIIFVPKLLLQKDDKHNPMMEESRVDIHQEDPTDSSSIEKKLPPSPIQQQQQQQHGDLILPHSRKKELLEEEEEEENPLLHFLLPSFRTQYSKESFGSKSFSIYGYGIGMILLILSGIMTWFLRGQSSSSSIKTEEDLLGTWKER